MIRIASYSSRVHSRLGYVENMAATTDTPSVVTPEWESDSVSLKSYSTKKSCPSYAKVVKGSYMNIGSSKFSLQRQHQEILVHSVKMSLKVLAHCVRRIDTTQTRRGFTCTRLQTLDQRLAIPVSYQGWFELLSEDGKSAKPYISVIELSKAFPEKCLVRENVKAYKASSEGKLTFDKTRIVPAGEQLTLCGEVSLPAPGQNKRVTLLKCTDSKGESLYLSFDQKGIFTPIAGPEEFTGVFSIRDIIRRFRLPLTVKLVQGVKPKVDTSRFTGLIRLDWVYTDETAFVCPLERNHVRMLPVPTDTNLMLCRAKNQAEIRETESFRTLLTKCNRMVANYNNTVHLIVSLPESVIKNRNRSSSNVFSVPQLENAESRSHIRRSKSKEDMLMDEIDDLYGYVRDGGKPPKSKFTYDSDEESYWEEPAYEPIDQFRARLMALEAGKKVVHHEKYKPTDPTKLGLENDPDVGASGGPIYGQLMNGPIDNSAPSAPHVVPRRSVSVSSEAEIFQAEQGKASPPPLPPRQYVRSNSVTAIYSSSGHSQAKNSAKEDKPEKSKKSSKMKKSSSKESKDSNSSSSGGHRRGLGRDFRDSDISSRTRGGSSGEQGITKEMRKRMQTLYL